jgi:hypothetical protein
MSDKMREEFEAWAVRYHGAARIGIVGLIYSNESVQHDWNVWQASRAALVVDLSDLCEASYTFSGTCYKSDVEYRLDEVGVSYK